jgi:hypothetical protein
MKNRVRKIESDNQLKVGTRVFWNDPAPYTDYTSWASYEDPHPNFPNGYRIMGFPEMGRVKIESHAGSLDVIRIQYLIDNFLMVVEEPMTSLEKEQFVLEFIGYRKG